MLSLGQYQDAFNTFAELNRAMPDPASSTISASCSFAARRVLPEAVRFRTSAKP
jgi:hypothetical protein